MIFFGILDRLKAKYIFSGALLLLFLLPVLGMALPGGVQHPATPERQTPPDSTPTQAVQKSRRETRREIRRLQREADRPPTAETRTEEEQDSLFDTRIDSIFGAPPLSPIAPADSTAPTGNDSLLRDSLRQDTTQRDTTRKKSFLDDIISGKNQDSLYYDVRNRTVYIYNQGDINYQNMNLKGDFMRVNMDEKIIYAHGKRDTIDGKPTVTNPTFTEGAANPYTMDTITYNIGSKKAKIKGVALEQVRELRSQLLLGGVATEPVQDVPLTVSSLLPSETTMFLNPAVSAVPLARPLFTRKVTVSTPVLELMGLLTPYSRKWLLL